MSVLMAAAGSGHLDVVRYLLSEGAPWNAVDRKYLSAGDYAAKNGHQTIIDALIDHAVTCEMLLSLARSDSEGEEEVDTCDVMKPSYHASDGCSSSKRSRSSVFSIDASSASGDDRTPLVEQESLLNSAYLRSRLEYSDNGQRLMDTGTNLAVMMDWERPLMSRHAEWICFADHCDAKSASLKDQARELRVLNVGFGMGIVDTAIQSFTPTEHVIIEAHPQVLDFMRSKGWQNRRGVSILSGRWQEAVITLKEEIISCNRPRFDGIFFDTYAEDDTDLRRFHSYLPYLLRQDGGRYSYYNGLCPDNVFFHGVACETQRLLLKKQVFFSWDTCTQNSFYDLHSIRRQLKGLCQGTKPCSHR
ncbi:unnamed protein product [Protopolystoma xenopodis]|uniref:RMT2 domain-containing protein n=1 Tax=Protopolystoma xenopodis TaxID=117903 RepID=A0A448WE57_9PLAT|nr:unnamed protein product [Protopolystoma xenopodis]